MTVIGVKPDAKTCMNALMETSHIFLLLNALITKVC